jgi:hypothetical protein
MTEPIEARPPRWAYLPFQITITVAALMLFDQAVFAGQFLSGSFGALHTHRENATYSGIAVLLAAGCAALVRWPGKGPIWPLFACLGLFALIALQIVLGFARALTVHIPLGVSIIMLALVLVTRAWRIRPRAKVTVPEPAASVTEADKPKVRL